MRAAVLEDVREIATVISGADEDCRLIYVSTDAPGIARRRAGRGFIYHAPDLGRITDQAMIRRIRSLAIPPAWRDVWICHSAEGHIQAFGLDGRGRRQYCYHPDFRRMREGAKFEHLLTFARALPDLRRRVAADMSAPGLGMDKVLATVTHLLEATAIRVGNRAYARDNKSYGLTTLHTRHVRVEGAQLRFQFKGKSGKTWRLDFRDRRVAKIVKACQHLPGQHLFEYLDTDGCPRPVTSADVNAYLRRVTGQDITAKDFRTWTGTVLAAQALATVQATDAPAPPAKVLRQVIKDVAARLGNTPAVCRASYIHPQVIDAFLAGELRLPSRPYTQGDARPLDALRPEETAVFDFLRQKATSSTPAASVISDSVAHEPESD